MTNAFLAVSNSSAADTIPATPNTSSSSTKTPDNFVDFYEILQLPTTSTRNELKKQISALYLEAQKNLDHRNPQKKLFFNELYEVHLPRARYLFLDEKRRAEYDEHVRTFRDDRAQQTGGTSTTSSTRSSPNSAHSPNQNNASAKILDDTKTVKSSKNSRDENAPNNASVKHAASAEIDVAQLAQHRENLWRKWQESLDSSAEIAPRKLLVFTPEQAAREEIRDVFMRKTSAIVREEERLRREESRLRQQKRWDEQAEKRAAEIREIESEKQRQRAIETRHFERAKRAGQSWQIGGSATVFLVGAALIFALGARNNSVASSTQTTSLSQGQSAYRSAIAKIPGEISLVNYDRGMEGTSYHETTPANLGGKYRTGSGVDVSEIHGDYVVIDTAPGEWIEYSINVARAGNYDLSALVASEKGGGEFQISVNGNDKTGNILVPATGNNDTFGSVEKTGISLQSGKQVLRLNFVRAASNSDSAGNFNSISFRQSATSNSSFAAKLGALLLPLELFALMIAALLFGNWLGARIEKRHAKTAKK